ncbi:MAG: hypothetical protein HUU46_14595 [Candidatus Hydrogenedentes bacterium]|nr:hypothetical protein [Candidatus Hydrogenedentota bacterium]
MTNECGIYRAQLREAFDAGAGPPDGGHASTCAECAVYRDTLWSIAASLAAMPLEVPRNALKQRVKMRLAAEPSYANDARWWLPAAAVAACALLVGLTVYYAVPTDPYLWWDYANQTAATPDWLLREMSITEDVAAVQRYWSDFTAVFASVSSPLLWAVAAAAVVLLVCLNGAEAYRLRLAAGEPVRNRKWRA